MHPTVLTYHKIGRQLELGITTITRRRFKTQLDRIAESAGRLVRATDAVSCAPQSGHVGLTFDDGYECVYTEAFPEMAGRGIRGTVFVVVDSIGRWNAWDVRLSCRRVRHLSWPQIRELVCYGFEFGSHGLSHRDLTKVSRIMLREELRASKMILEDHIGVRIDLLSYPFGRFSPRVIDEAKEAGYTYGFASYPQPGFSRMAIGRMAVYSIDHLGSLRAKLGLGRGYRFECLKNKVISKLSLGTTLVKRQG